jgi:hypothetical protein
VYVRVRARLEGSLRVPLDFVRTAPVYDPSARPQPHAQSLRGSPQTDRLLALLQLQHRVTVPYPPPPPGPMPYPPGHHVMAKDDDDVPPLFVLDRGDGQSHSRSLKTKSLDPDSRTD